MNERLNRLKAQLSLLRPRSMPADLAERIGVELTQTSPSPWADRLLLLTMGAGAVAACLIVGILVTAPALPPPAAPPAMARTEPPRFGDYPLALARSHAAWPDRVE